MKLIQPALTKFKLVKSTDYLDPAVQKWVLKI